MSSENEKNVKAKNKLSDTVFFQGVFVCIINIVLCLICLSTASWAWFYDSHTVPGTTLHVTDYDLQVELVDSNNQVINPDGEGVYDLLANEEYAIILKPIGTSGNGYAIIYINDFDPTYTQLIPITDPIVPCVINVNPLVNCQIKLDLRWGTNDSEYQITQGDQIIISEDALQYVEGTNMFE